MVATDKLTTTAHPSRIQTGHRDQADATILATRLVDVVALAGITLLSLFLFWTRVRLDPTFFNGDILTQFMPLYTIVAERLRAGDLPGWNPGYFSGMPLAGDPISGWGYLPVMGFFLFFGPLGAYQLSVLFHLTLAGVATYLLARKLGIGPLGGLVAAIAYEAGPLWYFAKIATARMQLAPWIPLGLLTVEMAVRSRRWSSRLLWWGLSGVVIWQMIAGYFGKGMYYGILTIGAYVLYRTLIDPPVPMPIRERLIAFAMHAPAVLALGVAFAAIVLLPRLDFMGRANLAGGSYEVVAPGVATAEGWTVNQALANILNPNQLKYYIGGATFALAVAGVILARRRFGVPFFALFSAGVLILTLAPTPLHTVLYLLLPKFKVIHEHVPSRILVVFNIGPAMLAGAAVASIERRLVRPITIGIAALGVVAACGGIAVLTSRGGRDVDGEVWTATLVVAALLGIAAVGRAAPGRLSRHGDQIARLVPAAGLLLILFWFSAGSAIDQLPDQPRLLPPLDGVPLAYADQQDAQGAGAFLKSVTDGSPFRYFGYDNTYLKDKGNRVNYHAFEDDLRTEALLTNNRALILHLQDIQGYNPVHSMRYVEYMDALNGIGQEYHETDVLPSGFGSPLLALLNAKYVVLPANPGPEFQAPRIDVHRAALINCSHPKPTSRLSS